MKKNLDKTELKEDCWTPALKSMALETMDKMISKPTAIVVSMISKNHNLETIRDKIAHNEYQNVSDWTGDVFKLINILKENSDQTVRDIGNELQRKFSKKFELFNMLSNFRFQEIIQQVHDSIQV